MSEHIKQTLTSNNKYWDMVGNISAVNEYVKTLPPTAQPTFAVRKMSIENKEDVLRCKKTNRLVHQYWEYKYCPFCGEEIKNA